MERGRPLGYIFNKNKTKFMKTQENPLLLLKIITIFIFHELNDKKKMLCKTELHHNVTLLYSESKRDVHIVHEDSGTRQRKEQWFSNFLPVAPKSQCVLSSCNLMLLVD